MRWACAHPCRAGAGWAGHSGRAAAVTLGAGVRAGPKGPAVAGRHVGGRARCRVVSRRPPGRWAPLRRGRSGRLGRGRRRGRSGRSRRWGGRRSRTAAADQAGRAGRWNVRGGGCRGCRGRRGCVGRSGLGRSRRRHGARRSFLDRTAARCRAARHGGERSPCRRLAGAAVVRPWSGSSRLRGLDGLGRLLGRGGLLGLDRAAQTFGVGLAADAVGLGVLDGGRVALDPDAQGKGQLEPFLVGQAQLFGQLIDADLLRQVVLFVLGSSRGTASTEPPILAHQVPGASTRHQGAHGTAAGPRRRWTPRRPVRSRAAAPRRPGNPASPGTARPPAPHRAGPPTVPRPEA